MNEVAPLQKVQDTIRDKIKGEFVGLIPDEMWSAMVSSVVAEFTTDTKERYDNRTKISPMKEMIRSELEKLVREKLKIEMDRLDGPYWDAFGQQAANDAVKKMIADNFKDLLASVQSGFVETAVMIAVNNIRNSMNRGM